MNLEVSKHSPNPSLGVQVAQGQQANSISLVPNKGKVSKGDMGFVGCQAPAVCPQGLPIQPASRASRNGSVDSAPAAYFNDMRNERPTYTVSFCAKDL